MDEERSNLEGQIRFLHNLVGISLLLLASIAGLLAYQIFTSPSEKWSYSIVSPSDEHLITALNKAGADGWEVVSARRATSGEGSSATASYELILKRHGLTYLQP